VRIASKHHQLLWIFSGLPAALVREMYYISVLAIGEIQDLHVARIWQVALDSINPCCEGFFAINKPRIDRKLTPLKALVKQKVTESAGMLSLLFGVGRQVKHNKYPHQTIS
jgi:hypothetical protein